MTAQDRYNERMKYKHKKPAEQSKTFKISPRSDKGIQDYLEIKYGSILNEYKKQSRKMLKISYNFV